MSLKGFECSPGIVEYVLHTRDRRNHTEKYNIKTVFDFTQTLRSQVVQNKPEDLKDIGNYIYEVPCKCGKTYIGET